GIGALRVDVEGDGEVGLRRLRLHVGQRRGPLDRADLLAVEVGHALDGVVVLFHHDVLAGDVVRAGEVDDLLAGVVDGVGGRHHVDLALLDGDLPHVRGGLDEVDVLGGVIDGPAVDALDDELGDLDVEALDGAGR